MKALKGVYCGSFDPITLGHEAVILSASKMYDLTILIACNSLKKEPLFNEQDREKLIKISCPPKIKVQYLASHRTLGSYCIQHKIDVIVRGLRNINDLEYELQIASVNADQCPAQTVFIPAPPRFGHISSSMVKEVASLGGNISKYVNVHVKDGLFQKINKIT